MSRLYHSTTYSVLRAPLYIPSLAKVFSCPSADHPPRPARLRTLHLRHQDLTAGCMHCSVVPQVDRRQRQPVKWRATNQTQSLRCPPSALAVKQKKKKRANTSPSKSLPISRPAFPPSNTTRHIQVPAGWAYILIHAVRPGPYRSRSAIAHLSPTIPSPQVQDGETKLLARATSIPARPRHGLFRSERRPRAPYKTPVSSTSQTFFVSLIEVVPRQSHSSGPPEGAWPQTKWKVSSIAILSFPFRRAELGMYE